MKNNILRDLRKQKNLKQKDIAEQLNMTPNNYTHLENSDISKITTVNLQKLADFYNVTIDYLLGRNISTAEERFIILNRTKKEPNLTQDQYKMVEDLVNSLEQSNKKK